MGVIANEFFDPAYGGRGGFGWAARQVALCFNGYPALGVEVTFLTPKLSPVPGQQATMIHGTRLLFNQQGQFDSLHGLLSEGIDLLLTIDYRPNYRFLCEALHHVPIIVWVHDPRPPEDVANVDTLRIPGAEGGRPKGTAPIDCTSLAEIVRSSRSFHRPVLFASPAPHLADKATRTYGLNIPELMFLPNIIDLDPGEVIKNEHPRVIFLGRLDPIKRPWLFVELARQFPQVEFLFLGQAHFHAEGAWRPVSLPGNVRLMGHLDGAEKLRILSSAWVLVNTSIHEGLAVSFLEALACETPLLGCQDPGGLVSRFGVYVGRWDGTGLEGVQPFAGGLNHLLSEKEIRVRLGKAGRRWVTETHSRSSFLLAFGDLCARAGISPRLELAMSVRTPWQSAAPMVRAVSPEKNAHSQSDVRDPSKPIPTGVKGAD